MKAPAAEVDCTMTVMTDTSVSGMTFGSGRMFIYEDRVHRRRVIAAD